MLCRALKIQSLGKLCGGVALRSGGAALCVSTKPSGGSVLRQSRGFCWLSLCLVLLPFPCCSASNTGYYIGLKGGVLKEQGIVSLPDIPPLNNEYIRNALAMNIIVGYAYEIANCIVLAGQWYIGHNTGNIETKKRGILSSEPGKQYDVVSNLSIRPKRNFGFDALLGLNAFGCLFFVSAGVDITIIRVRGDIVGYKVEDDASNTTATASNQETRPEFATFFGNNTQVVNGINFPQIKPPFNLCPAFSVGAGVRKYFCLDKLFVGLEMKYLFDRSKNLKATVSRYDPTGVTGGVTHQTPVVSEDKMQIPLSKSAKAIALVIGLRI
ncbi:MAG: hypothetical protein LBF72_00535 [Holosporales bacterium]|jgi:hypothetical protein|nr:hypothetical protein [Holosporales bacterium]